MSSSVAESYMATVRPPMAVSGCKPSAIAFLISRVRIIFLPCRVISIIQKFLLSEKHLSAGKVAVEDIIILNNKSRKFAASGQVTRTGIEPVTYCSAEIPCRVCFVCFGCFMRLKTMKMEENLCFSSMICPVCPVYRFQLHSGKSHLPKCTEKLTKDGWLNFLFPARRRAVVLHSARSRSCPRRRCRWCWHPHRPPRRQ